MTTAMTKAAAMVEHAHTADALAGVYAPQHDSRLLIATMRKLAPARGLSVADLCTGSGAVALAAAADGADRVDAFELCPVAAAYARANSDEAGVAVDVHHSSWVRAVATGPYHLVTCNPPYVPTPVEDDETPEVPAVSVNGGHDGRLVIDPLCVAAPALLYRGGTLLLVQSEFADVNRTLKALQQNGLQASVVARQRIPFGPVLRRRAQWLEEVGLLRPGRRTETLAVVAARKP